MKFMIFKFVYNRLLCWYLGLENKLPSLIQIYKHNALLMILSPYD